MLSRCPLVTSNDSRNYSYRYAALNPKVPRAEPEDAMPDARYGLKAQSRDDGDRTEWHAQARCASTQ